MILKSILRSRDQGTRNYGITKLYFIAGLQKKLFLNQYFFKFGDTKAERRFSCFIKKIIKKGTSEVVKEIAS